MDSPFRIGRGFAEVLEVHIELTRAKIEVSVTVIEHALLSVCKPYYLSSMNSILTKKEITLLAL